MTTDGFSESFTIFKLSCDEPDVNEYAVVKCANKNTTRGGCLERFGKGTYNAVISNSVRFSPSGMA